MNQKYFVWSPNDGRMVTKILIILSNQINHKATYIVDKLENGNYWISILI